MAGSDGGMRAILPRRGDFHRRSDASLTNAAPMTHPCSSPTCTSTPNAPAITELFGEFMRRRGTRRRRAVHPGRPVRGLGRRRRSFRGRRVRGRSRCGARSTPACRCISSAATAISCSATSTRSAPACASCRTRRWWCCTARPTLLMHGDLLCTDDVAYQAFRTQTRDPAWQAQFLAQPLASAPGVRAAGARGEPGAPGGLRKAARVDGSDHRRRAGHGRGDVRALRHRHHDPRPHPSPGGARRRSTAGSRASCWATGTNRDRCCAWMRRRGFRLESLATRECSSTRARDPLAMRPQREPAAPARAISSASKPAALRAWRLNGPRSTGRAYSASSSRNVARGSMPCAFAVPAIPARTGGDVRDFFAQDHARGCRRSRRRPARAAWRSCPA